MVSKFNDLTYNQREEVLKGFRERFVRSTDLVDVQEEHVSNVLSDIQRIVPCEVFLVGDTIRCVFRNPSVGVAKMYEREGTTETFFDEVFQALIAFETDGASAANLEWLQTAMNEWYQGQKEFAEWFYVDREYTDERFMEKLLDGEIEDSFTV